ncbi:MAG: alkaline phosphatase [Caldimicrobium sp.]|nr:alkaline phosphatase [Caldimicrobium sp.]MCX7874496.1 alkaline phosphatase [Caldimicrobium sp.]MDW8094547.1 alkaline phosphatase [Caldimicrobium sp.]
MGELSRREFLRIASLSGFLTLSPQAEEILKLTKRFPKVRRGIIFLVGDGWPLGVMKAYLEYAKRVFNIEPNLTKLFNDPRSVTGIVSTNSLSSVVTDSAPASVAWGTGSKTANRVLAVLPDGRKLKTIAELAKERGLSVGFVTTTRITHATPAGWYSHHLNRDAEDDIAVELLNFRPEVALGGGRRHFEGRKDGRNLFVEFANAGYEVVLNRDQLRQASLKKPLLGIFASSHLSYYIDRANDTHLGKTQPTLPEMTAVALSILARNPKGFLLQVEAGRIDHAMHNNDMAAGLYDCYEMDMTLGVILSFIERNPHVLLIVTSDHGNAMYGINGTGPEYNHSTEALLKYRNVKASFEYLKNLMKGKTPAEIKEILVNYTGFSDITIEEAQEVHNKLNTKTDLLVNDFWYEPEATLGRILSKSIYQGKEGGKMETKLRRGNVYFTSTNHTAEDQLYIIRSSSPIRIAGRIDNTYLFKVMCDYLNIKFENPKMTEEEYRSKYAIAITPEEWMRHLELHVA